MQRDKSLDIAKGFAILLMMYGHLRYTFLNMDAVYSWIYSFHMPFFVYITGLLTTVKTENKGTQLLKKAKTILLPYVFWNLAGYIAGNIFQIVKESPKQFIRGMIVGDNLNSNLPTWYLMSYFWLACFLIFIMPYLDTVKRLIIADTVAVVLVFVIAYVPDMQDYFRLKGAIVLLPFLITGYLSKKIQLRLPWWLVPIMLYAGFKLGRINAVRSWRYITVGSGDVCVPYLYLASAICTTLAVIEVCRWLSKISFFDMIGIFGRHTLIILCTHWLFGNILGLYMEYGVTLFLCVFVLECFIVAGCEAWSAYTKNRGMNHGQITTK